tara:strand:- start:981 stop:1283 length:303 start_codon:yes stop_codon:yes gene_type:complete
MPLFPTLLNITRKGFKMAYNDVAMVRERMKNELLMGETPRINRQTAGSPKIPGYGDVFAPINKALRKKEAEDRAKEREKAAKKAAEAIPLPTASEVDWEY